MFSACLFPHPTPVYSSQSVMCVGTRGFCSVHEGNFAILPCKEAAKRKDLNIRYQNRVQFFNCHKLLTPVLCLCQVNVDSRNLQYLLCEILWSQSHDKMSPYLQCLLRHGLALEFRVPCKFSWISHSQIFLKQSPLQFKKKIILELLANKNELS